MLILLFEVLLISIASHSLDCDSLKKAYLKLSVHGSNYKFAETTRGLRGGPYKPLVVQCKRRNCQIKKVERYITRHIPDHVDADKKGMVRYPDIDRDREKVAFSAAVEELEALADHNVCGSMGMRNPDSLILRYEMSSSVESDVVLYSHNRELSSWVRNFKNGKSVVVKFDE